jgi:hypothetical protein
MIVCSRLFVPPFSDCRCMLWIVTVGVETQAMAEGRFGAELFVRDAVDVDRELAMSIFKLLSDLRQGQASLLLSHNSIKAVDSAMCDGVSRWLAPLENRWEVFERFLLPVVTWARMSRTDHSPLTRGLIIWESGNPA